MARTTEYGTWCDERDAAIKAVRDGGNVHDYLQWRLDHPSPLGGVMGMDRPKTEVALVAVEAVFQAFEGRKAEVTYRGDDPNYSVVYATTGELAGLGFILQGSQSTHAVMIRDEFGRTMAIPAAAVTGIEDA